eukprot:TRINITY_DN46612_c0_g1_i2.p1 TRINITY_DN46612_c0_g1~~TRINITY_DN46612_c0_g1_i2.p1  ORF type:complete len:267 (+),score=44.70 TRINITY_DN46612_c0_g1_i2:114-803(+)
MTSRRHQRLVALWASASRRCGRVFTAVQTSLRLRHHVVGPLTAAATAFEIWGGLRKLLLVAVVLAAGSIVDARSLSSRELRDAQAPALGGATFGGATDVEALAARADAAARLAAVGAAQAQTQVEGVLAAAEASDIKAQAALARAAAQTATDVDLQITRLLATTKAKAAQAASMAVEQYISSLQAIAPAPAPMPAPAPAPWGSAAPLPSPAPAVAPSSAPAPSPARLYR